jgi:membrane complex biogenesis BtpA family protein
MRELRKFTDMHPLVIAALHLPAFQIPGKSETNPVSAVIDYALRNTERAVRAGVQALYIQDLGDYPWASTIQPQTVADLSVIGAALRGEFPELFLGICTMSHGAREPLAIAQAVGAQFVRLKVYIGAMVKAEGILQGCAHEAISYRSQIGAENIAILADVYDRTGEPLGRVSLKEAATQAAVFGRADGLILTGHSFEESLRAYP